MAIQNEIWRSVICMLPTNEQTQRRPGTTITTRPQFRIKDSVTLLVQVVIRVSGTLTATHSNSYESIAKRKCNLKIISLLCVVRLIILSSGTLSRVWGDSKTFKKFHLLRIEIEFSRIAQTAIRIFDCSSFSCSETLFSHFSPVVLALLSLLGNWNSIRKWVFYAIRDSRLHKLELVIVCVLIASVNEFVLSSL